MKQKLSEETIYEVVEQLYTLKFFYDEWWHICVTVFNDVNDHLDVCSFVKPRRLCDCSSCRMGYIPRMYGLKTIKTLYELEMEIQRTGNIMLEISSMYCDFVKGRFPRRPQHIPNKDLNLIRDWLWKNDTTPAGRKLHDTLINNYKNK